MAKFPVNKFLVMLLRFMQEVDTLTVPSNDGGKTHLMRHGFKRQASLVNASVVGITSGGSFVVRKEGRKAIGQAASSRRQRKGESRRTNSCGCSSDMCTSFKHCCNANIGPAKSDFENKMKERKEAGDTCLSQSVLDNTISQIFTLSACIGMGPSYQACWDETVCHFVKKAYIGNSRSKKIISLCSDVTCRCPSLLDMGPDVNTSIGSGSLVDKTSKEAMQPARSTRLEPNESLALLHRLQGDTEENVSMHGKKDLDSSLSAKCI